MAGLAYGVALDRRMPLVPDREGSRESEDQDVTSPAGDAEVQLPGLAISLLPILLPILLITGNAAVKMLAHQELIASDG